MSERVSIKRLTELHEKATPGPWRCFAGFNDEGEWASCGPTHCEEDEDDSEPGGPCERKATADAELMEHTRNALPALLALAKADRRVKLLEYSTVDKLGPDLEEALEEQDEAYQALDKALAAFDWSGYE